jgi:peptide deformylase
VTSEEKIRQADLDTLRVVHYPDPRLREVSTPIEQIDESVRALTEKMFDLMVVASGVGLAAPQVGVTVRLFVGIPTEDPNDRRVYINPEIVAVDGSDDGDEGCLSFPGITCRVKRFETATIRAQGLDGELFEETGTGLAARIYQHESDHLDGRLLVDRMGTVAKLAARRTLKDLVEEYEGE